MFSGCMHQDRSRPGISFWFGSERNINFIRKHPRGLFPTSNNTTVSTLRRAPLGHAATRNENALVVLTRGGGRGRFPGRSVARLAVRDGDPDSHDRVAHRTSNLCPEQGAHFRSGVLPRVQDEQGLHGCQPRERRQGQAPVGTARNLPMARTLRLHAQARLEAADHGSAHVRPDHGGPNDAQAA